MCIYSPGLKGGMLLISFDYFSFTICYNENVQALVYPATRHVFPLQGSHCLAVSPHPIFQDYWVDKLEPSESGPVGICTRRFPVSVATEHHLGMVFPAASVSWGFSNGPTLPLQSVVAPNTFGMPTVQFLATFQRLPGGTTWSRECGENARIE